MKFRKIAIAVCALALLTACGSKQNANANANSANNKVEAEDKTENKKENGLNIVTSTYITRDLAQAIAGDSGKVTCLIPKGQGVHGFEPSPKDMNMLKEADLFIYNGAGLESWVDTVKDTMGEDGEAVEASKGIELLAGGHHHHHDDGEEAHEHDHDADNHDHDHDANANDHNHDAAEHDHDHDHDAEEHDHDHGGKDPHVWMSVKNAKQMAQNIADAMIKQDPGNKATYEANLAELNKKLDALDTSFKDALAKAKTKDIVVSHEAYGYLAKDYGLHQIPIEGINSESEPDPKAMKEIIETMKQKGIKFVFTEPHEDDKIAQTIASETGAQVKELDPLEYESDKNYIERMESNLKVLESALQ
ncbi:metal ABC transporter substrate-binding protein [Aedoeadaptatus coxii]|uniref:metal ABC transporter substrate-binding protein n=1 Tax=Aedoeadaptatus coxii TaxID=755172 RepID=UPI002AD2E504|nr:metal ABC transporter substrate-binding protein [Peptoniphilus coxii]